jgi:hypothetical protein
MDVDYCDLSLINKGERTDLEQLFDRMAEAGFDATTWDHFWCGTACYHSKRFPVFSNAAKWKSAINLANTLKRWDPLAYALTLAKERNIMIMAYFRMMEEAYAPFDGDEFFRKNPEYWLQSRCGMYRMVGYPCYNYPEVREHMLERVEDLVEHGIRGALFDIARSHIPYFCPYRSSDGFGFNKPVVEEFKRRHGVDLSKFDYVEDVARADHGGVPFTYEHKWVGAEPFDMAEFGRIHAEWFSLFLKEVRRRYPDFYIAFQAGHDARSQQLVEGLCAEHVINEYSISMNYRTGDLNTALLPRFQHVVDNGIQLTAWLNDFFSPTGGGTERISVAAVKTYVDQFLASKIDGAVIHEACFLLETEAPDQMWKEIARLKASE